MQDPSAGLGVLVDRLLDRVLLVRHRVKQRLPEQELAQVRVELNEVREDARRLALLSRRPQAEGTRALERLKHVARVVDECDAILETQSDPQPGVEPSA